MFRLSYRALAAVLIAVLILSLVPMLLLSPFTTACADDYSFSVGVHAVWAESSSLVKVLQAAAHTAAESYYAWQGSYSAIFLMALQPAVFGEALYALTPALMLLALAGGLFSLCAVLFGRVFHAPRGFGSCVAALLMLVSVQLAPSPVQGFYWYNGSVYYTFFFGLSLVSFALALYTADIGGVWRIALLSLLNLLLGGGNYVTALNAALIFTLLTLALRLFKRRWARLLAPLGCLLLGLAVSAAAPGNAVRGAAFADTPGALEAVLLSFPAAADAALRFFSLPVAGVMLLIGFLAWQAAPETRIRFRLPGLITLLSVCLFAAQFTPTLYAMGSSGDGRLTDILFYAFLLLLALNVFYWVGWLRQRVSARVGDGRVALLPLCGACLLSLSCAAGFIFSGHGFTSLMALGELRSGEAAAYRAVTDERLTLLRDPAIPDAVLPAYPSQPYLLYFDDITPDPDDWRNLAVTAYYGKNSVVLEGDPPA